jgi:REP element-mobilizing transposase RayT
VLFRLQAQFSSESKEPGTETYAQQRLYFGRFDELLDASHHGPTWLNNRQVAQTVADSLQHFNGKAYTLICYCIMPNHVHVVVSLPDEAPPLVKTLQRLKGYSALQANKVMGRTGQFWQRETYDHIVRSPEEMTRVIAYVINNPVKAGLVDNWEAWPHTYWQK